VDEERGRVQLSLLPLDQLEQRDAQIARRRSSGDRKKYPHKNVPHKEEKKPVTMDDAMAKLMQRFGRD
jgi:uncharacterized protein